MSWRDTQAGALAEQAAELDAAIEALRVADDVLASRRRHEACAELRATTSMLASEANDIRSEATALQTSSGAPLPMSFTTRHVRRRRDAATEPEENHERPAV